MWKKPSQLIAQSLESTATVLHVPSAECHFGTNESDKRYRLPPRRVYLGGSQVLPQFNRASIRVGEIDVNILQVKKVCQK